MGVRYGRADPLVSIRASPREAAHLELKVIEARSPLDAAVAEARRGYDLVVVGVAEEWGLEPRMFAGEHERLAAEAPASLLIVRKYRRPGDQTELVAAAVSRADTPAPSTAA